MLSPEGCPWTPSFLVTCFALPSPVPPALSVLSCFEDGVAVLLVLAKQAVNRQRAASPYASGTALERLQMGCGDQKNRN